MPDFTLPIYNTQNFTLLVNAVDKAGNGNALYVGGVSSITFIVDNQPPVATLTLPISNAKRQQLLSISGSVDDNTATDYPSNSGVSGVNNVDVLTYYTQAGTTYYWNGSVFTSGTVESAAWQTADGYVPLGTSSATWTYNALDNLKMNPPTVENGWVSDRAYVVKTRARDNAFPTPNLGAENIALNVIIDTTSPTSGVTYPNTTPIRALSTITGTANADLAGFGNIKFSIKDQTGNYFTGSSFSSSAEVFLDTRTLTGLSGVQVYTSTFVTSANLTSGSTYTINIYGTDAALPVPNTQVGGTAGSYIFYFDNTPPETLTITAPLNSGAYGPANPLSAITGAAVDNHSGVNRVELEIYDQSDNSYWGGSSFNQVSSSWVAVGGSLASWSYAAPTWIVNKNYQLRARATDVAGNISTTSVVSFIYDTTAPVVSAILIPSQLYQAAGSIGILSGTANDGLANPYSGLQTIQIALYDQDDGDSDKWYSGSSGSGFNQTFVSWRTTSSTITASSSAPWSYPFGSDTIPTWQNGHQYNLYVRAQDAAQNISAVVVSTFVYDPTNPTGFITKPNGTIQPHYEKNLTILSGTANDTTGGPRAGSVSSVQIRMRHISGNVWWDLTEAGGPNWDTDNSVTDDTAWITATTTDNWTDWYYNTAVPNWVSGLNYAISMRVIDAAGNISSVVYSTFTFDTNLPNSAVTNPATGGLVRTLGSGIQGTATDSGSPVAQVRVAIQRLNDGLWWNSTNVNFTDVSATPVFRTGVNISVLPVWSYATSSLGDGNLVSGASYYITSEATDSAGNVQTDFSTGSSTFSFDNTPPLTSVTQPTAGGVTFGGDAYYSSIPILSGIADDFSMLPANRKLNAGVGAGGVKVSVLDLNTSFYFSQGAGNFSETDETNSFFAGTFVGMSSGTWSYTHPSFNGALTSGHTYVVKSSATDNVGNVQTVISSQTFVFDSSAPASGIVTPVNSVSLNSLTIISGTARDYPITLKRVGMSRIDLQIIDLGDDQVLGGVGANADRYWDGVSTFTTTLSTMPISISGQGQVTWSYDNPDNMWEDGHTYLIRATPVDALNNAGTTSVSQFIFDSSAPITVVTRPAEGIGYNGSSNQLLVFSATAQDLPASPKASVGVNQSQVFFSIRRDDNNNNISDAGDLYWDGTYPGAFNQASEVDENLVFQGGVNYSTTAPLWVSGYRYFMETWAVDNLGNVEGRHTRRFTIDILPPTSAVGTPVNGASLQTLATITGTASDATSGISAVYVTLQDLGPNLVEGGGDDLYWSSSSGWVTTSTQVIANLATVYTTSATWSLTTAGNGLPASFPSGRIFHVIPQATDSAANVQAIFSTSTFQVDNTPPVAGIITPPNNSGYNSLSVLSGTVGGTEVLPNLDFSSIQSVNLQIIDISTAPAQYWNGSQFTIGVATRTALFTGFSSGTWVYSDGSINSQYVSGHLYRVIAWASDSANNTQTTFVTGISSNVFFFDNVPALSNITVPADGADYNAFPSFNGVASDDFSGVNQVNLTISYIQAGTTYYWGGASFSTTYTTVPSSITVQNATSATWTYNTGPLVSNLVSGQQYYVFSRAMDRSSNYEIIGTTHTFLYDLNFGTAVFTAPQGLNAYRSPANPLTQILGTAVDAPVHPFAGVARNEVRIRRNPPGNQYWDGGSWVVNSSTWLVVTGTTSWSFPEPSAQWQDNTQYLLNVRTYDLAGNLSPFPTQNFVYDSNLPLGTIQNPNTPFERSLSVISGTAGDAATSLKSGLLNVKVAIEQNPAGSGNWWDGVGFNITAIQYSDDGGDAGNIVWVAVSTSTDPGTWTMQSSSVPAWTNDTTYLVKMRAQDVALNFSNPISSYTFTYDNVAPTLDRHRPRGRAVGAARQQFAGYFGDGGRYDELELELCGIASPTNGFRSVL